MEKKASMATPTNWRTEITKETRVQMLRLLHMTLREQCFAHSLDGTNMKRITDLARELEMKLFNTANSKDDYLNAINRKMNGRENRHGSSSSQAAVPNPQYLQFHQPAEPNSLLQQYSHPMPQVCRQKLNVRQTHQQFRMHNQSCASPQNTLNSQCQPQQNFGIHLSQETFTQHPNLNLVNLQPNKNLTTQVKKGVNGEGFHASKSTHQHPSTPIDRQHKQQPSMGESKGASVVPEFPNSSDWHDVAFVELERFKNTYLPIFKKAYEPYQVLQTERIQPNKHTCTQLNSLQKMIIFLQLPKNKLVIYTKEKFYRCLQTVGKVGDALKSNTNLANKQSSLHGGQPDLNVKTNCQPVIQATTGSSDSSLPNRQLSENIQVMGKSANLSPQIHEPSQLSHMAEQLNPCPSLHARAFPNSLKLPDSKTEIQVQPQKIKSGAVTSRFVEPPSLGSNEQLSVTSPFVEPPGLGRNEQLSMTSPFVEPSSLGSNEQLSTATQPFHRLLKAIESASNGAVRAAVSDIGSVMEDTIIFPWGHAKATDLKLHEGCGSLNNMKRKINAITLNDMSSSCSDIVGVEPKSKKHKKLLDSDLLEEMRNINNQYIETVLEIDLDENLNRRLGNAGTVLRFSFNAATNSKSSKASPVKLPVLSVKLLVPLDYPEDYPVFLSKFATDSNNVDESRVLSIKATSMLRAFLRTAPDYLSLKDYAMAWNECARRVVSEYAQRAGGGCFNARYGTWEDSIATS